MWLISRTQIEWFIVLWRRLREMFDSAQMMNKSLSARKMKEKITRTTVNTSYAKIATTVATKKMYVQLNKFSRSKTSS